MAGNEHSFKAKLDIIDINPFVFVPDEILQSVYHQAGKDKGPIPVKGTVNGRTYTQTLMRFRGHWRLYINLNMLDNSPRKIGEELAITIGFDPADRSVEMHPKMLRALEENPTAKDVFGSLPPSRKKEIARYFASLKTDESIER